MKAIRILVLAVVFGSPVLGDEDGVKVPKPEEVAVPAGQRLELFNCDAGFLATVYSRYTGTVVKVAQDLRGTGYSLVVRGPLTNADAARFIENQLLLDGCVIKDDGPGRSMIARGTGPWKMPAKREKKPEFSRRPDPDALCIPQGQRFEYPNIDARTCAMLIGKLTGKRVLLAPGVSIVTLSTDAKGPVTNAEGVAILEKALLSKGVFLKEFAPGEMVMFPISRSVVDAAAKGTRMPRVMRVPAPR